MGAPGGKWRTVVEDVFGSVGAAINRCLKSVELVPEIENFSLQARKIDLGTCALKTRSGTHWRKL
jgi:hypothetical protein